MEQVEKAAPDGYTLAMITQGTHVFNLSLYKTLRYDPQKIVPITPIAAVSNVMTVNSDRIRPTRRWRSPQLQKQHQVN